jgi:hypothetical protein
MHMRQPGGGDAIIQQCHLQLEGECFGRFQVAAFSHGKIVRSLGMGDCSVTDVIHFRNSPVQLLVVVRRESLVLNVGLPIFWICTGEYGWDNFNGLWGGTVICLRNY